MSKNQAYDAFTGESIDDKQRVIAFLLVDEGASHHQALLEHSASRPLRLSSLPVHGYWDAKSSVVVPDKTSNLDVLVYSSLFDGCASFIDVQNLLNSYDSGPLQEENGEKNVYSMMVISEHTFEDIKKIPKVVMFGRTFDPDKFVTEVNAVADFFIKIEEKSVSVDENVFVGIRNILAFKSKIRSFFDEVPLEVPHETVRSEFSNNRSPFSWELKAVLSDLGLYGDGVVSHLEQKRRKPAHYDECLRGLFDAGFMNEAMHAMNRTFAPSVAHTCMPSPETNLGLMVPAVIREMELILRQQADYIQNSARVLDLEDLDHSIEKIQQGLAVVMSRRNELIEMQKAKANPR